MAKSSLLNAKSMLCSIWLNQSAFAQIHDSLSPPVEMGISSPQFLNESWQNFDADTNQHTAVTRFTLLRLSAASMELIL